jgi:hypothetical protein
LDHFRTFVYFSIKLFSRVFVMEAVQFFLGHFTI